MSVQQKQSEALQKLQNVRNLLDQVDAEMAEAILILEQDGAYSEFQDCDGVNLLREQVGELEELVRDYVN